MPCALQDAKRSIANALVDVAHSESSGLHGIRVLPDGALEGGADPRREGVARTQ